MITGLIASHVDVLLYGGTEQFQLNVIEKLCHILKFGTENALAVTDVGMSVKQYADFSITLNKVSFAESIFSLELPLDDLSAKDAALTDKEQSQYQAAMDQLNWLAGISHPEISFDVCHASAKINLAIVIHSLGLLAKLKWIVRSTFAAKTLPLNDGCDSAFYMSKLISSIMSSGNSLLKIVAVTGNQSAIDAIYSTSVVFDKWLRIELATLPQCHMH